FALQHGWRGGLDVTATPSFQDPSEPESTELLISGSPFRSTSAHPGMTNRSDQPLLAALQGDKSHVLVRISAASEQTLRAAAHHQQRSENHDHPSFVQTTHSPP